MSLVNVGVQLAQSGRKILLVDFDLEAPGLPTFSLKKPKGDVPGIVEYVSQYIASGESPDVTDYIYKSSEDFSSGGSICVMPVGRQDATYSHRLNLIDWGKLYSEQSGFLFMEDLKRQWAEQIAPDYVLIDSRTGHSDVEGICTRQLPNAVCLLFFPNEQNLQGLKRIVANIKTDNERFAQKKIRTHFVVSNVPDLDDEDEILGRTMKRFRRELGYKELAAEIHHYNSLSLLNQEIFSLARPNSRLTKEYRVLTKAITAQNLGDREAVIEFLKLANRDILKVMDDSGPKELQEKLQKILENFTLDGEIRFHVSLVYEQLGSNDDALSMLSDEIVEQRYATASMYATRARLRHRLGQPAEAVVRDLQAMLEASGADIESFLKIVPIMDQLKPQLFDLIPESQAFKSLSEKDQLILAYQSEGNENQLKANVTILRQVRNRRVHEGLPLNDLTRELSLAAIGIGDFNTAIELLGPVGEEELSWEIDQAFNLAMAIWGRDGSPPFKLFEIVLKKDAEDEHPHWGPNYLECIAISHASLGNVEEAKFYLAEARKKIGAESARVFSAWSYSKVTPQIFLSHLEEIEKFTNGVEVLPKFMSK